MNFLGNLSSHTVLWILVATSVITTGLSAVLQLATGTQTFGEWLGSWLQNFSTGLVGTVITFILINMLLGSKEKQESAQRETQQQKERLIRELRSEVNDVSRRAAEELRAHGWLSDGSLHGARLNTANLQGADLQGADLQRVDFYSATLRGADLRGANLKRAYLGKADLQGAILSKARFDENTVLPDGTRWTPSIDLTRFTDASHPDFWHPAGR